MMTESMPRLQVERVGCDPQLIAAPVWQDWQKRLTKQVTNKYFLTLCIKVLSHSPRILAFILLCRVQLYLD
jgi:hypothetical protein